MLLKTARILGAVLTLICGIGVSAHASPDQKTEKKLAGYKVIVLKDFTVDKNPATEDFPLGLETMMHSRAIARLRDGKLFETVADASEAPAKQADGGAPSPSLILSATVLIFDKGSRAGRYFVGFGAGQAKLKVRFIFADGSTGAEVLRYDQVATFKGIWNAFGGSEDQALASVANGVVKGLVKQIQQNR